ncbi:DMT family transporter [Siccirubricoccus phaeus]|uniref:DMT family transporter n=1 Tax=Siccirubricoccus phaeus TaxID=2595053 RepID=UPI001A9C87EF|nr:DMT family transporter [Siccirubricoccus phaeus]
MQGYALVLASALAWGGNWPIMKLLMLDWPAFAFRVLCAACSVVVLGCVALAQGQALLPRPGQWGRLSISALLNVTSWGALAPIAIFWLDASEAAIIAYTMPVWATMLAWPFLGERPGWQRFAGLGMGLAGVTLLMAGQLAVGPPEALLDKLPGVAAILGTALLFAGGVVFTKRYPVAMAPVPLVAWQLIIGMAPVLAISLGFERLSLSGVTARGWLCLAYGSLAGQVLAYLAWFRAIRLLPAGNAALGALLVPVVGVLGSGLILGEPLGVRHAVALVLTLGGVALASRG